MVFDPNTSQHEYQGFSPQNPKRLFKQKLSLEFDGNASSIVNGVFTPYSKYD
jgi:hypothetical protein